MPEHPPKAPANEQTICVPCGFCCDGTLFLAACLNPGERGNLPDEIEKAGFSEGDSDYFRLPCNYFHEKCVIYESQRADVCSSYRCQLLKDFAKGKITLQEAMEVVAEAKKMRSEVIAKFQTISGKTGEINFRNLLSDLGGLQKSFSEKGQTEAGYEMLLAQCNIFEALLIKHMRSAEDFEKMMLNMHC